MTKDQTQGEQGKRVPTEDEIDALCGLPADEFDRMVEMTFSEDGPVPPARDISPGDSATENELADCLVDEAIQADRRAAEGRS